MLLTSGEKLGHRAELEFHDENIGTEGEGHENKRRAKDARCPAGDKPSQPHVT